MTEEEMQAKIAEIEAEAAAKVHKANTEAKSLRDRLKNVSPKALETYDKIKAKFGVDDVGDDLLDELEAARNGKTSTEDKLAQLQRRLDAEAKKTQEASQRAEQLERKHKESERDQKILAAFGKVGISSQAMAKAVRLAAADSSFEDGEWTFEGMGLDEYAQKFAKENPYMVGNPVRNGNGDSGSANYSGKAGDFISEKDYLAMTPEQQADPKLHKIVKESMHRW